MADHGDNPFSHLSLLHRPALHDSVLPTLLNCISSIAKSLRDFHRVTLAGSNNAFGDDQLVVDVLAERIIRSEIAAKCPYIVTASSEEEPEESAAHDKSTADLAEKYTIAFDPLDGSSIIGSNWTVGTIIGIWDGASALHQDPTEKQIGAVLGVYGSRTTAIVALRIPGTSPTCLEISVSENGSRIIRPKIELLDPPFQTRYFAPANLRASAEDERYAKLISRYMQEKYTLRYSGGLVPDVVNTLVKGHGIYVSPVTEKSKAKLRRLYELAPVALVMECAGGSAIDPVDGKRILDRQIQNCDERAGLVCGTTEEVELVKQSLTT
ncbi:MAG: hypothetical protein M1820_010321 [Bogoriella megaspora]|nr:MAG: hypothetical protein M1820_010321 [Bogoriella megaspora]